MLQKTKLQSKNWLALIDSIGEELSEGAVTHDQHDTFVRDNYELLKQHGLLTAMIPEELGGDGIDHQTMCAILRKIAHYCPSTALALSMHQHLLAANIWKYRRAKGGETMLEKVAKNNLVLISTGARDWLESNGKMEKANGGYRVSAEKHFASQSVAGNVLVTSAPFRDSEQGWQVLHFPVPMDSEGVIVQDNWYTMGMRGTGSNTVKLENVFVPDSAIVLQRPRGEYHMFWNVVLTVAMPLIMSVYVGIAEKAAKIALSNARNKEKEKPHTSFLIGEMNNYLTSARVLLQDMITITNNFDFQPDDGIGVAVLTRKTLVAEAAKDTVGKAMEAVGGRSFFRDYDLERLFRDIQASSFHPLPEKQQQHFAGEYLLKQRAEALTEI